MNYSTRNIGSRVLLIARPEPARIILRWLASEGEVEAALAEIEAGE